MRILSSGAASCISIVSAIAWLHASSASSSSYYPRRPNRYEYYYSNDGDDDGDDNMPRRLTNRWEENDESYSSSDEFIDLNDIGKKPKRKANDDENEKNDKAERILRALEIGDKATTKARKSRRTPEPQRSIGSSTKSRKTKKKRRKKQKPTTTTEGSSERTTTSQPLPTKPAVTEGLNETETTRTTSQRQVNAAASPKPHPDRTAWEVPAYSHKISTMMKNNPKTTPSSSAAAGMKIQPIPNTETTKPATTATKTTTSATTTTTPSVTPPWVRKFLAGRPKDRLLPLPRDYISDNFNLAQLPPIVERIGYQAMGDNAITVAKILQQHRLNVANSNTASTTTKQQHASSYPIYRRALLLMLKDDDDDDSTSIEEEEDKIIPLHAIQKAAEALYLMLHARFVVSPRGLEAIRHVMALDNTVFGKCPRSSCKGTGLLPYGHSNDYTSDAKTAVITTAMRKEHDSCCHRYCPSCGEVWVFWDSKTDGCAWGPSWCHLFLLAFGGKVYAKELEEAAKQQQPLASQRGPAVLPRSTTVARSLEDSQSRPIPSVFGFRVHPSTSFGRPFNDMAVRGGDSPQP